MATVTFEVYKILEKKFGEAEATEIVKAIDSAASDIALQKYWKYVMNFIKELASKSEKSSRPLV